MGQLSLNTPVGIISVFDDLGKIVAVEWGRVPEPNPTPLTARAVSQLKAYFNGTLKQFDLPLRFPLGDFKQAVLLEICRIPYGATCSYGDIGKTLGYPAQAIGGACGKNPIPILIPCHRVVGSNRNMIGYSGGDSVEAKAWLLQHEGLLLI